MTDLPLGPNVTVWTRQARTGQQGAELELSTPGTNEPLSIPLAASGIVETAAAQLGDAVGKLATLLRRRPEPRPADAAGMLESLAGAGRAFLTKALLYPKRDLHRLTEFITAGCQSAGQVPLFHCVSTLEEFFPWELLPVFNLTRRIEATDKAQLWEHCAAFLGFGAIVERRDPFVDIGITDMVVWDRLKIRMVYDSTYPGAKAELGFFRSHRDIQLDGPFPRSVTDTAAPSLARQLTEPKIAVNGTLREYADDIVHIACHCETEPGKGRSGPLFRLADQDERHLEIHLDALLSELALHWANSGAAGEVRDLPRMPLVFLNACGTAPMQPAAATSMLMPFHKNGNAPIVGTVANVPDGIASQMSRSFYLHILNGRSVGEALHAAKWDVLHERGNPLGLLYSLHAFAATRLLPLRYPTQSGDW